MRQPILRRECSCCVAAAIAFICVNCVAVINEAINISSPDCRISSTRIKARRPHYEIYHITMLVLDFPTRVHGRHDVAVLYGLRNGWITVSHAEPNPTSAQCVKAIQEAESSTFHSSHNTRVAGMALVEANDSNFLSAQKMQSHRSR
jgi:hypothetical protein